MLTEQELEGILTLALQLQSAQERFTETRHGAEQVLDLQRTLGKYVKLLQHIHELEKQIEALDYTGWGKSEIK